MENKELYKKLKLEVVQVEGSSTSREIDINRKAGFFNIGTGCGMNLLKIKITLDSKILNLTFNKLDGDIDFIADSVVFSSNDLTFNGRELIQSTTPKDSLRGIYKWSRNEIVANKNINKTDNDKLKQGYWIIKAGDITPVPIYYTPERTAIPYSKESKYQEGKFVNNKREGVWYTYFPNGMLQSEITYKNNKPDGFYTTYYDNGCYEVSGIWKGDDKFSDYKHFFSNCNILELEIKTDNLGKRVYIKYDNQGKIISQGEYKENTLPSENGQIKLIEKDK
ncbi:MAG: toxin-antitoxin system YwqK family antitoxin [Bacteroidia bacterium]